MSSRYGRLREGRERAKLTGAKLAQHIVAVQKAAGATPKMMLESARSVMNRPMTRASDRASQAAYVAEAMRAGILPDPEADLRRAGPRMAAPDREAGQ